MAQNSKIEWTDSTWNPVRGCSRVSEGCRNCYAELMAARFSNPGQWGHGLAVMQHGRPHWTGKVEMVEKHLLDPLKWGYVTVHRPDCNKHGERALCTCPKRRRRIFVNSVSDLFHEAVTDEMRDRIFAVMALCPQHDFQVLTKRPERMRTYMDISTDNRSEDIGREMLFLSKGNHNGIIELPLANIWMGVSVENQKAADERIPVLLETPAAVRFVSFEPLLGPVDLDQDARFGGLHAFGGGPTWCACHHGKLDWVICGGESGPNARPMHPDWARSLRDQCKNANVPFFFKQWGEYKNGSDFADDAIAVLDDGRVCDGTIGEMMRLDKESPTSGGTMMRRVGKKAAGSLLDGAEHKEFPEVSLRCWWS
jgi:protein gp37